MFKGIDAKTGKWVYGFLLDHIEGGVPYILTDASIDDNGDLDFEARPIVSGTECQDIGKRDINGVSMFMGDIIQAKKCGDPASPDASDLTLVGVIGYSRDETTVKIALIGTTKAPSVLPLKYFKGIKVIGNIYAPDCKIVHPNSLAVLRANCTNQEAMAEEPKQTATPALLPDGELKPETLLGMDGATVWLVNRHLDTRPKPVLVNVNTGYEKTVIVVDKYGNTYQILAFGSPGATNYDYAIYAQCPKVGAPAPEGPKQSAPQAPALTSGKKPKPDQSVWRDAKKELPPDTDHGLEFMCMTGAAGPSGGVLPLQYVVETVRGKTVRRWRRNGKLVTYAVTHWAPRPAPVVDRHEPLPEGVIKPEALLGMDGASA